MPHPLLRWLALGLCSAALSAVLLALHVPAAVLLGCMVCAIGFAVRDAALAVPRAFFGWGQGLLGCLMAASLQPRHLGPVLQRWPLFLGATLLLIAASTLLGWWLMRRRVLPGTTALWGLTPGAASAMVVLAEQYGADARLVAFMQYTRVLVVTLVAALVTRLVAGPLTQEGVQPVHWWAGASLPGLAWTAVLVLGGGWIARRLQIAGGAMVLPLAGAALLEGVWGVAPSLPPALMLGAYAAIGWSVGLRFTRGILLHALRALPQVLLSTGLLILVGMATAAALVLLGGMDALSAFLATCPGGADSMAVIAATSAVDTGFVMAMQLARFLIVLLLGPALTARVARASAP